MEENKSEKIGKEGLLAKIIDESVKSHLLNDEVKLFFSKEEKKLKQLSDETLREMLDYLMKLNELENKLWEKILSGPNGKAFMNGLNKIIKENEKEIIKAEQEKEKSLSEKILNFK